MDPRSSSHPIHIDRGDDSEKPHFFRIILPAILEDGILELPPKFVIDHGEDLAEYVSLEVPEGSPHTVEVGRYDNRIWLDQGWQEFIERYSIGLHYFLVFRYEGGSAFHVFIYDLGCTEIDYPVIPVDESIVSESPPRNHKRGKEAIQSSRGFDYAVAKERTIKRAKAFESDNVHFISIMRRAYLTKSLLYIPECSATSYFHEREDDCIQVNGPDGTPWLMKFYITDPPQRSQVRIKIGWREFVNAYHLQVDDVCVFELINISKMVFNVIIFRVNEEEEKKK